MTIEQLMQLWQQVALGISPVEEAICRDVLRQGKGKPSLMARDFRRLAAYCEGIAARLTA